MRSWWVGWPARPDPHATSRSGGAGLRSGLGEKCFGGISPFLNLTICMLHGHRLSWMLVWGGGLWFEWGRLTHPPKPPWKMVVWGGRLRFEVGIIRNINGLGGWVAVWVWFILYPTVFLNPVTIRTILARHHQNQQCSECIWMQCWNMNWGLRNTAGVQKHISNALSLIVFLSPQPILQHCIQMHSKH